MKRLTITKALFKTVANLLFPVGEACIHCARVENRKNDPNLGPYTKCLKLCQRCATHMKPIRAPICHQCGRQMDRNSHSICFDCRRIPNRYVEASRSAFQYEGVTKDLLTVYKFRGRESLARPLALVIEQVIHEHYRNVRFDGLLYVPIHPSRQYERGFNQAELIALEVSKRTKLPLFHALEKTSHTIKQSKLGRNERLHSLQDAIRLKESIATHLENKTLLLIDDIYTTGATGEVCAKSIRDVTGAKVYMATIAR